MKTPWLKRALPWALYDWANSAFATTVMAAFVPIFNQDFWSDGAADTVSTFRLGTASSIAAIIVALLAPILGVVATAGLALAGQGQWALALTLYVFAWIGFAGANIFYDSLLVSVADEGKLELVSALGYSLGYIGGGLLLALNVTMTLHPAVFGLADANQAVRLGFLLVAVWWALFSLPLLFKVPEVRPAQAHRGASAAVRAGFTQLVGTFHEIRQLRAVFLFLLAYWLYIDGVATVIQMAVDYGCSLQLATGDLITALLLTQFVGFPAALVFGKLGERFGAKSGILLALVVYTGVCVMSYRMTTVREFYVLALVIGLVQGGVQSLSRSFFARLIPAGKAAKFFGFYNMLGKFAAILGPAIVAAVALGTGSPRLGILAIIPLFIAGGLLLLKVNPAPAAA